VNDEPGLITEVPAHIRAQSAPPPVNGRNLTPDADRPEPATPTPDAEQEAPEHTEQQVPQTVPEERTRVRAASTDGDIGQRSPLRQPTGVTVPAVWCPSGHFSPPAAAYCRTCGAPVPEQRPIRVPRPALGTLHLPEGDRVVLDRAVVLGRRPLPLPAGEPWPHLVELPSDLTHLSRNHVAIELDGWHVLARDLGSSGGTRLQAPGRPSIRLRPHDPHVLEPGWSLVLSGDFTVTYQVATS